ncbi:MAG: SPOR domain-containing protein [Pseudomonadota bacterium]
MAIRPPLHVIGSAAVACIGVLLSCAAHAAYTIQIGAFRNPSMSFTAGAAQVASVYVTERSNGIKALSVGSFDSRAAAADALSTLQDEYPDAYIATLSESAMLFDGSAAAPPPSTSNIAVRDGPSNTEQALLDRLSDAERSRVVYLDGVLHMKSGSDFVPLTEYNSN